MAARPADAVGAFGAGAGSDTDLSLRRVASSLQSCPGMPQLRRDDAPSVCLVGDQSFFARTGGCVALLNRLSWLRKLASELLS